MWLNNLRINDKKVLSPIEFLVLANCVSDEFIKANEILNKINNQIEHWSTTPGTIYPILHRLKDLSLLEQDSDKKMAFKISKRGIEFFVAAVCAFEQYLETDISFFFSVIRSFILLDPIRSVDILQKYQKKIEQFLENLKKLNEEIEMQRIKENWISVKVEFPSDENE